MNALVSVRVNLYFTLEKIDNIEEYRRQYELIFLIDKPKYTYSNEGEIIRERGVSEVRFLVSEKGIEQLSELLLRFKDVEPDEMV